MDTCDLRRGRRVQEIKVPTFAELGMEFPLFAAPSEDADVDKAGTCGHCGKESPILFGGSCYACFRSGLGSQTIDTEYGMVRPEDAAKGHTHGIPLDPRNLPDLPLIAHPVDPRFPDEHWYGVQFAAADLIELTRTPRYHTWQGERWLFCCNKPSIFLGGVDSDQLTEIAAARKATPEATIADLLSATMHGAARLHMSIVDGTGCLYLFRCQTCSRLRAHFDMD